MRRDAIVQVAARSFLENGYAGTTMSGIAALLGGSKGTLWSYFRSKEDLFIAVYDRLTAEFQARLALILDTRHDPQTALRGFCREFLHRTNSGEGLGVYRLVVAEATRFPEIGAIFYERGPMLTHRQLSRYIAAAMERGALRRADPQVAARQLIGVCLSGSRQHLLVHPLESATDEAIAADIEAAMDIFMRGYGVAPPPGEGA